MKKIVCLILLFILSFSCREQSKKDKKMLPVEVDGGIGDGAPSLDTLLKHSSDSLHTHLKDSI